MATFNSLQMTPPRYPVSGPTGSGRAIQNARGEFNLGVQSTGALAAGDTVRMFRLHRNFLVSHGALKWDALGAGVTISLGDAANPTRYFTAQNAAAAGSAAIIADTGRDFLNAGAATDVILTIGGATTAATGKIVAILHGQIENPL